MYFQDMTLIEPLQTAVKDCGYDEPTPIQQETIPPVLAGRDVLGCAQTGTGKTAAFALPILQRLHTERKQHTGKRTIRALILTPTRELALQIYENFQAYGKRLPLRACVIFGGVGQAPQVDQLRRGVDILVATPGRLGDLIGQGYIALNHLEIFVLDEADRMLDMGFIHDVRKVIALLPEKRQTLFFSATMPAEVEKLALSILSDPVTVKVDPVSSTVDAIEQSVYFVDKGNKKNLLAQLLKQRQVESALVFTRTKHGADRVVRELARAGIDARAIHGDKSQGARQQALSQFKHGDVHVMVATDIAARGIDIAGLSHVINYDIPNEPEAYVHRIGRTGRAGMEGVAISFCSIEEMKELKAIETLIDKRIPCHPCDWPLAVFNPPPPDPTQSRRQKRPEPMNERDAKRLMADRPVVMANGVTVPQPIVEERPRKRPLPVRPEQPKAAVAKLVQKVKEQPKARELPKKAREASPRSEAMRATPLERSVRPATQAKPARRAPALDPFDEAPKRRADDTPPIDHRAYEADIARRRAEHHRQSGIKLQTGNDRR